MTDSIRAALERLLQELKLPSGTPYAGLLLEQAENELRAALAAQPAVTPAPSTDAVLKLAAILREVNSPHLLGAAAMAEAILSHHSAHAALERLSDGPAVTKEGREPAAVEGEFSPTALAAPTPPADGEAEDLATLLAVGSHCPAGAKLSPEQCRRAAALLRQLPPEGLEAIRYCVADDGAVIQRTSKDPESWAVRSCGYCMSHTGKWEIEPQPSARTHEWLATHRWPTVAAAWEALQQARRERNDD